jgi:hypothetical protein
VGKAMTLRFSATFWFFTCLFLVAGAIADWNWLGPAFSGDSQSLSEFQFFLMICSIFGLGGVLMGAQIIRVSADTIESRRFFLLGRTLNRNSCRVRKYSSSGFVLEDASGQKIHVHKLMIGADELHKLISSDVSPEEALTELADGIRNSSETRIVNRLKLIKPAFLLLALFVSGLLLIADTARDVINAVKGNGHAISGKIFLFALGAILVSFCVGIVVLFFRGRSRKTKET